MATKKQLLNLINSKFVNNYETIHNAETSIIEAKDSVKSVLDVVTRHKNDDISNKGNILERELYVKTKDLLETINTINDFIIELDKAGEIKSGRQQLENLIELIKQL